MHCSRMSGVSSRLESCYMFHTQWFSARYSIAFTRLALFSEVA